MEYFKRKLNAGEKAISSLTLQLKTLAQLRLNFKQALTEAHYNEDVHKSKQEKHRIIHSKAMESFISSNEDYFAYFPMESDYHDADNVIYRSVNAENNLIILILDNNKRHKNLINLTEEIEKQKECNLLSINTNQIKEKVNEYILLNLEAAKALSAICDKIRQQLKELTEKQ